jgi:hypothetical protein
MVARPPGEQGVADQGLIFHSLYLRSSDRPFPGGSLALRSLSSNAGWRPRAHPDSN